MIDKSVRKVNYLAWVMATVFGVITSFFLVWGYQLEKYDSVNLADKNALILLLCFAAVLTVDAKHVWDGYNNSYKGKKFLGLLDLNKYRLIEAEKAERKEYFFVWILLIVLNIPVLLAEFPGFFVYDAQDELNEVLTRTFSTHHPLLHVLFLGGTIALVHKLVGSWNAGIFCYLFIQMLIITAIFAYVILYLRKRGINKKAGLFWTLFYGLFPTVVMFVLCSSKDGLFAALLTLLTVFLLQMTENTEAFIQDKKRIIAFILTASLMPCFRHNGFYAYLVFLPFAFIYFKKNIKSVLTAALVAPVMVYILISSFLSAAFSSEGTHHQEILTVPIMQMVRVYEYDKDSMTQEEVDTLKAFIPEENLNLYSPRVSDMVKVGFNNKLYEESKGTFWRLWFTLFKKHPFVYVNSWFLTSYGYWYPVAKINVYQGTTVFTFTYDESSYFGYEVEQPGERHSLIPVIDSLYRYLSIGSFHKDAPVLALFFSPGVLIIIYLFVLCYRISIRDLAKVVPFIPVMLTWATVLLGPTYLVRYVIYLWFCLPLLFVRRI
ncbi:DUF6020 family protein [Butyrivibrio sp. YAB3001]|uniref:DUF6020 family protein n=1 Tax=Butyrivibrio sp. YAB3001 TaxID=1520812 RepID=UPI0008F641A8|nr:DUF6020 family protein [Butyrivibrio sp. YAB3001]SFC16643.1 Predicted membrane protein [Butyrivibrio sp. YAB3001]